VHSINCPNVTNLLYETGPSHRRAVGPKATKKANRFPIREAHAFCDDRFGMLKQITSVITDQSTNIRNIEARTSNGQASIDVVLEIADLKHLQTIITVCARFLECMMCRGCRRSSGIATTDAV